MRNYVNLGNRQLLILSNQYNGSSDLFYIYHKKYIQTSGDSIIVTQIEQPL